MGPQHWDLPLSAARGVVPDNRGPLSYSVDAEQGPVRLRYFTPPEKVRPYFGSLYNFPWPPTIMPTSPAPMSRSCG
jgi:hypothetical protein